MSSIEDGGDLVSVVGFRWRRFTYARLLGVEQRIELRVLLILMNDANETAVKTDGDFVHEESSGGGREQSRIDEE